MSGGSIQRHRTIAVALATTLAACVGAERHSESPDDAPGESLVRVIEALASDVENGGSSCDDFAELLSGWVQRERETVRILVDDLDRNVEGLGEEELADLDERLTVAFEVLVHRASECGEHRGAQRAFAEFDAVIDGA